jgi:DNA polymerase (family 10)
MARSNDAAAPMLQEFAGLLAISGGDAFKVRAYEKAARAVAGYRSEIAGLNEKGLDAIPSVGSHLARKIIEFRDTGSVEELDEPRAAVPAGLRTLLAVPGLGPKRARQVYDQLGITSVSELLDALHDERLRGLRGWVCAARRTLPRPSMKRRPAGDGSELPSPWIWPSNSWVS